MVTGDPAEAAAGVAAGRRVVLIVGEEAAPVVARPGRLAILVGDPADPAVRAAAAEMDGELHRRA